ARAPSHGLQSRREPAEDPWQMGGLGVDQQHREPALVPQRHGVGAAQVSHHALRDGRCRGLAVARRRRFDREADQPDAVAQPLRFLDLKIHEKSKHGFVHQPPSAGERTKATRCGHVEVLNPQDRPDLVASSVPRPPHRENISGMEGLRGIRVLVAAKIRETLCADYAAGGNSTPCDLRTIGWFQRCRASNLDQPAGSRSRPFDHRGDEAPSDPRPLAAHHRQLPEKQRFITHAVPQGRQSVAMSVWIRWRLWLLAMSAGACTAGSLALPAHAGVLDASWTAPTMNTDGTRLTDLQSYQLYYGTSSTPCPGGTFLQVTSSTSTPSAGQTVSVRLSNLTPGVTYTVAVTAVDSAGDQSACSLGASATARIDFSLPPAATLNLCVVPR